MACSLYRAIALALVLTLVAPVGGSLSAFATCGGGGGGGLGGSNPGGSAGTPDVYHVPWKIVGAGVAAPQGELLVYWFPTSPEEARGSELLSSRYLSLTSALCVSMALVTNNNQSVRTKYSAPADRPIAVLSAGDGSEIGRVEAKDGKIAVSAVEALLRSEIDRREQAAKEALESAKAKQEQNDQDGAAALYTRIWEQRCLIPSQAKKAAKALKKLGKPVSDEETSRLDDGPVFSEPTQSRIVSTMRSGLAAEWDGRYLEAKRLYSEARKLDPADPVPARFLGELLRHHTGEWTAARAVFNEILAMRADPLSRAVAQHGLGKMTIHAGGFKTGLALFEASIASYPLPLTYRNLAVYWNSEKQGEKSYEYVKKAIELDPEDPYNQIFAATYLVELGRPEEAAEIARRHSNVLAASYNLAAIYAQLGDKQKTLELLRRHFYVYERFATVRTKEMQEARDDIVFVRYHQDPDFVKLTALADEDAASYHKQ